MMTLPLFLAARAPRFHGPHSPSDEQRFATQGDEVLALMSDGAWRTPTEIAQAIGCRETSASARLRDIRKPPPEGAGLRVDRRRREGTKDYEYRVVT